MDIYIYMNSSWLSGESNPLLALALEVRSLVVATFISGIGRRTPAKRAAVISHSENSMDLYPIDTFRTNLALT